MSRLLGLRPVACVARARLHSGMADLDTVISLSTKAAQLYEKGHFERCAQKWRAALAAAEARGAGDSVILAAVKANFARFSFYAEALRGEPSRANVSETFAQYAASTAILRQRRDAGTLLQGFCRPEEVRWRLEMLRGMLVDLTCTPEPRSVPATARR